MAKNAGSTRGKRRRTASDGEHELAALRERNERAIRAEGLVAESKCSECASRNNNGLCMTKLTQSLGGISCQFCMDHPTISEFSCDVKYDSERSYEHPADRLADCKYRRGTNPAVAPANACTATNDTIESHLRARLDKAEQEITHGQTKIAEAQKMLAEGLKQVEKGYEMKMVAKGAFKSYEALKE